MVTNRGTITVDPNFAAVTAGTGNQVTNAGIITGGDFSAGIVMLGGTATNTGSITVGANGAIGLSAPTAMNSGSISVGDASSGILGNANGGTLTNSGSIVAAGSGSGISLNTNVSSVSILNSGSISVGDDGAGILGDSTNNNLTIVNSGTITFGGCGTGISATGTGNAITNSGTLAVAICGGGGGGLGVDAGDSNTVTNTGNIVVSDFGGGISGGSSSILRNSGTIRTGDDGIGIFVNGDNTTASNSGTIVIGDTSSFAGGIVGTGNNLQFSNSGTIVVGRFAFAMGVLGGDNATLSNSGTLTIARDGFGMAGQGNGNRYTNSGTISLGRDAFGMFNAGDNATFLNTGTITGGNGATGMGNDSGNNPTMTNSGTIVLGDGGTGMGHNGDGGVMTNRGTIIAGDFGAGMVTQGSGVTLVNSGTISVGADGTGMGSQGIGGVVSNSGSITVGSCGVGIDTSPGSGSTVTNSGRIVGSGCAATGVSLGDGDTFTNSGVVSAPFSVTSFGTVTVMNTGTLDGALDVGGPGSSFTNAGLITISTPLVAGLGVQHFIDGSFTQTTTGTLALRVLPDGSAGNYDSLQVSGVAQSRRHAEAGRPTRSLRPDHDLSGVVSFASSTGQFNGVAPASLFLSSSLIYHADSVDLVLTRLPFNSVFGGGGNNARAIGNVLEANYSTSLTGALATFYGNLLVSTSPNTLAQLTGEVTTAPQNAAFGVFGQFLGTVFGQTATSRANGQAMADGGSRPCPQRHDRRRHAQDAGPRRGMQRRLLRHDPTAGHRLGPGVRRRRQHRRQRRHRRVPGGSQLGRRRARRRHAGHAQPDRRRHHGHDQRRFRPHRHRELGHRALDPARALRRLHPGPALRRCGAGVRLQQLQHHPRDQHRRNVGGGHRRLRRPSVWRPGRGRLALRHRPAHADAVRRDDRAGAEPVGLQRDLARHHDRRAGGARRHRAGPDHDVGALRPRAAVRNGDRRRRQRRGEAAAAAGLGPRVQHQPQRHRGAQPAARRAVPGERRAALRQFAGGRRRPRARARPHAAGLWPVRRRLHRQRPRLFRHRRNQS